MGKFFSGLLSQLLVSFTLVNYRELNYISLAGVGTAFVISVFLPSVRTSIYFHREEEKGDEHMPKRRFSVKRALSILRSHLVGAYSQSTVAKWGAWVAISTCLNYQIGNYIQPLWEEVKPFEESGKFFLIFFFLFVRETFFFLQTRRSTTAPWRP